MLKTPMDVLHMFPVRKTKTQKQAFRNAVQSYASGLGYEVKIEKGSMGVRNMVIGNPDTAKYLVTAHYDTCARMFIPNMVTPCNALLFWSYQILLVLLLMIGTLIISTLACLIVGTVKIASTVAIISYWTLLLMMMFGPANTSNANDNTSGVVALLEILRTMPENRRNNVCFVLFDMEEKGLLGSSAYRKAHKKQTNCQVVLNMDCVGDGDNILLIPSRKLKKNIQKIAPLYQHCGYFGHKSMLVKDKGYCYYPSDQTNFPYGVGIGAFHKKKWIGHYYSRIHTSKDTVLDITNVNILRAAITSLVCSDAAQ